MPYVRINKTSIQEALQQKEGTRQERRFLAANVQVGGWGI